MPVDMNREAAELTNVLADRGLTHLRVTKRGKALTIVSGPHADPEARLTLVAAGSWRLDLPDHRERWEPTPFVGSLAELVDAALGLGRFEDLGPPGPPNWGDTSDPSH